MSGLISPRKARILLTPAFLRFSRIISISDFELLTQVKCAIGRILYLFFIIEHISQVELSARLPPAPYVTLIKSGFKSFKPSSVSYIVSIPPEFFLGGKTSREKTGFFASKSFDIFIAYIPFFFIKLF